MNFLPAAELAAAPTHARADFVTNAPRITVKQVTAAKQANP